MLAIGGVGLAVIVGGGFSWVNKSRFESTDNAFIQADTVQVSPQVSGYVQAVLVNDNQHVEAGQILVRIDPATVQAQLDQAIANAAAQDAAVRGIDDKAALEQAMIAQKAAGVRSAQADAGRMAVDVKRYGELSQKGWVADQKVQQIRAQAVQSQAAVAQAQAALVAERRAAESLGSARAQTVAEAQAAKARVDAARIDLERTVIRAPAAGVIGARGVRQGQLVQPGTALMSIVPVTRTYIVANFKETQVAKLRIGQPVAIKADAFGGQTIRGRIDSFAPATGSQFALIPVENAVGNFTKIAQRVPVKIVVDENDPLAGALRPGLSVQVKVSVREQTGPSFAEAAAARPQVARQDPAPPATQAR